MISGQKKRSFKYILINIFSAAVITVFLFVYLFSPYRVTGNSMFPGLQNGDKVLIFNSLLTGTIKRFDILVITPPGMNGKKLIKRVIGLPGESIEIRSGGVLINNALIEEPFLKEKGDVMFRSVNMEKRIVPENRYFLLGDHREKSTDSRYFGPLGLKSILGKTFFRYWPVKRFGKIK